MGQKNFGPLFSSHLPPPQLFLEVILKIRTRTYLAGCIGNLLEHYDHALFGLMAPILAPLFFPNDSAISALIYTYSVLLVGLISRPIGALFFGYIGDTRGRKPALILSIFGMALATFLMGCIPTFSSIGVLAPIMLVIGRLLQSFFAAGESVGGAILVLEHAAKKDKNFLSSCFDASSMAGILIASAAVTILTLWGTPEKSWRLLYWLGALTAIFALFIRFFTYETLTPKAEILESQEEKVHSFKELTTPFFLILVASGFSYTTFSLSFTLMNGFIPLISEIAIAPLMKSNTLFLLLDLCLLPIFGLIAKKISREKLMLWAAMTLSIVSVPLFSLLNNPGMPQIYVIRFVIIFLGVAFAAPFHSWAQALLPYRWRYRTISLAITMGSQLIGIPSTTISLWLYEKSHLVYAPGIYLSCISSLAGIAILLSMRRERWKGSLSLTSNEVF